MEGVIDILSLNFSKKNRGDYFEAGRTPKSSNDPYCLKYNTKSENYSLNAKYANIVEDQGWNVSQNGFLLHTTDVPMTMFGKGKGKKGFKSGALTKVLKDLKLLPADLDGDVDYFFTLTLVKEQVNEDKKYNLYKISKLEEGTAKSVAPTIEKVTTTAKKVKEAKQVDLETVVSQVADQKEAVQFIENVPTPVVVASTPAPVTAPVAAAATTLPSVGKQEIDEVFPQTEEIQPSFKPNDFVDPFAPKPIQGVEMPVIPNFNAQPVVTAPEQPAFVPVVENPIPAPVITEVPNVAQMIPAVPAVPGAPAIPTVAPIAVPQAPTPPTPPSFTDGNALGGIDEIEWR